MRFGLVYTRFVRAAQPRCGESIVNYRDAAISRFKVRRSRRFRVAGVYYLEAWERGGYT